MRLITRKKKFSTKTKRWTRTWYLLHLQQDTADELRKELGKIVLVHNIKVSNTFVLVFHESMASPFSKAIHLTVQRDTPLTAVMEQIIGFPGNSTIRMEYGSLEFYGDVHESIEAIRRWRAELDKKNGDKLAQKAAEQKRKLTVQVAEARNALLRLEKKLKEVK